MIWNSGSILLILFACGVLVMSSDHSVDCRKFVFAPLCRGVAAKRMFAEEEHNPPLNFPSNKSFRDFLKNTNTDKGIAEKVENETNETHPLIKFYLRLKSENDLNKLLQESKQVKGDLKNAIVLFREYGNL